MSENKEALKKRVRNVRAVTAYFGFKTNVLADAAGITTQSLSYLFNEHDRALTESMLGACEAAVLDLIQKEKKTDVAIEVYRNTIFIAR